MNRLIGEPMLALVLVIASAFLYALMAHTAVSNRRLHGRRRWRWRFTFARSAAGYLAVIGLLLLLVFPPVGAAVTLAIFVATSLGVLLFAHRAPS